MPLPVLPASDERRSQAHHHRRCRRDRSDRRALTKRLADLQSMAAQGFMMRSGVDREHLPQNVSGGPVGHQGGEMRPKPVQLWYRPAMGWPVEANLDPAARGTAKPGKPHRDLAEQRRDRMVPVVLHTARAATVWAGRPPIGMLPGLRGDDLSLNARQQLLRFDQGQSQVGDIDKIVRPSDLHDVRARPLDLSPGFHQPQNPSHASTLDQRTNAKIPNWPAHPQSCDGPCRRRSGRNVTAKPWPTWPCTAWPSATRTRLYNCSGVRWCSMRRRRPWPCGGSWRHRHGRVATRRLANRRMHERKGRWVSRVLLAMTAALLRRSGRRP